MRRPTQGDLFHSEGREPGADYFNVVRRRRRGGRRDAAADTHADRGQRCGGSGGCEPASASAAAAGGAGPSSPGRPATSATCEVRPRSVRMTFARGSVLTGRICCVPGGGFSRTTASQPASIEQSPELSTAATDGERPYLTIRKVLFVEPHRDAAGCIPAAASDPWYAPPCVSACAWLLTRRLVSPSAADQWGQGRRPMGGRPADRGSCICQTCRSTPRTSAPACRRDTGVPLMTVDSGRERQFGSGRRHCLHAGYCMNSLASHALHFPSLCSLGSPQLGASAR